MSQPRFPDPASSRAVLIGASHFTAAGPELPDIPAVEANLIALRQALSSSETGVLCPERCRVLADPTSPDEVGTALSEAAATTTDLLLVYYAGHGLVDDRGRLHLALAHTHPHRARWSALPLDLLREEIANSAAATRVLVLDCCYSGRAIEAMTDDQGVVGGQLEVAGTYTLTATPANAPAHAPTGDRHTAFTGALLGALDHADPLTLDQIYAVVDRDLAAQNLPRPQRRVVNTAGDLALSRGPATKSRTEPPDSDAVRFTRTYRSLIEAAPRVLGAVFLIVLLILVYSALVFAVLFFLRYILAILLVILSPFDYSLSDVGNRLFVELVGVRSLVFAALISPILTMIIIAKHRTPTLKKLASGLKDAHVRELIVDRSGLTVQRKPNGVHLPWRDIVQVGVLQPNSGSLNPRLSAARYTWKPLLVVRLRPEASDPHVVSVLSDWHRQLGYLGLCTVEDLGSSRQEMIGALERFAGGKLVHSPRQFLDRDPRLRPEMV